MTGFILRIIAMLTMLADHIWRNFIDNPMLLTWIGRIAFPCYAFLLAEWFFFVFKEKRRLLKHIWTLIILAVISEPCYDLLEFWPNILEKFTTSQSVMITLLLWFLFRTFTVLCLLLTQWKVMWLFESKLSSEEEYQLQVLYRLQIWFFAMFVMWLFLHVFEDSMVNYLFFTIYGIVLGSSSTKLKGDLSWKEVLKTK